MRSAGLALTVIFAATYGAPAAEFDGHSLARNLGAVIAAEDACGLSYDQAAIEAFIEAEVPADAIEFPPQLGIATWASGRDVETMTTSAKTAHCTQIRRIARSYGFIE